MSRFLIVSNLYRIMTKQTEHRQLGINDSHTEKLEYVLTYGSSETPSCTNGQFLTSSLVAQFVLKMPDGLDGSIEPIRIQFWNGGNE